MFEQAFILLCFGFACGYFGYLLATRRHVRFVRELIEMFEKRKHSQDAQLDELIKEIHACSTKDSRLS
jgi:hypothetical protein